MLKRIWYQGFVAGALGGARIAHPVHRAMELGDRGMAMPW